MNVILLGYRGCGKSSVGRRLAERLGLEFRDVDERVAQRYGNRSVAEVWADEGEPHFRRTECAVTAELCQDTGQVVALGGGTVMQPAARQAVERADALRVYLKASPQVLAQRIEADAQSGGLRPSLTGNAAGAGAIDEVRLVLAEREPVYRAVADKVLDVSTLTLDQAVAELVAACTAGE